MKLSQLTLEKRAVAYLIIAIIVCGGVYGFITLGKKEDSTFVIKTAAVSCSYPGASPQIVEELITEPIEREIQSLRGIKQITSTSYYGLSTIKVELEPSTPPEDIPQLWDELRRKTINIEARLPEGASGITVNDDFGDVYGLYYALSADEGISLEELRDAAQELKRRVQSVEGIAKVTIWGEPEPVVNIGISLSALAGFSIRPEAIAATIRSQNMLISSGEELSGKMRIKVLESGSYRSLQEIENQLLMAEDGKQYRLGDIASVTRTYIEPRRAVMKVDSTRAIGIGISTDPESDVVKVGRQLKASLQGYSSELPVGITLHELYPEDKIAREATNAFILNLIESLVIVIGVIMVVMGRREGLLIGSSLLLTILFTLLVMSYIGEGLNRTSLAGFIITMGMLVDNSIVITDNARQLQLRSLSLREALICSAEQTKWSLLGATLIAIFSFLPLYLAPSSVAEIIKPLFVVITLSLLLSWLIALTQTPLTGCVLLGNVRENNAANKVRDVTTRLLKYTLRHRVWVVCSTIALFALSLWLMSRLPQNFFPDLDKPYFRADVILPEGYDIGSTSATLEQMERWLNSQEEVARVSWCAGGTPPRYYLASSSVAGRPNFGNILVELNDKQESAKVEREFCDYVADSLPDVWLRSSLFRLSPVPDSAIEFGFVGKNLDTLTMLATRAMKIMQHTSGGENIRLSPTNRIPTIEPIYSQMKGQRIGITRNRMAEGLGLLLDGYKLGELRDGDQIIPIRLIDEFDVTDDPSRLLTAPVFSASGKVYSVEQAIDSMSFRMLNPFIERYNRLRVVKAQCDAARDKNTKELFTQLHSQISKIELPEGYQMEIFGEEKSQRESNSALGYKLPLTTILILVVLMMLMGDWRSVATTLLVIPLILIGVVAALAISGKAFNFFALLGLLGLVGMNIKSAVVLIEQIDRLKSEGMGPYKALVEATSSRVIAVTMASATTILGMTPLLFDSLFGAMAATIMGGLLVASGLIIILLPTIYAMFYKIENPTNDDL